MLGCMLSFSVTTIGYPNTHPKISDSLLAAVQCSSLYLNFLAAESQFLYGILIS